MLKAAGAATLNLPSNESYAAMQTGACDALITSSTSLISFRLEELAKHLTSGRGKFYWFMMEPLMMSKVLFDKLPKDQQEAIMAVGADLEAFGTTRSESRRRAGREGLRQGRRQGADARRRDARQVARHRPRDRLEGLRQPLRELRRAAQDGRGGGVSHGFELEAPRVEAPALPGPAGALDRAIRAVNHLVMILGGVALVAASLVLTYSVVVRYILHIPTDWQDETAVFLIVGAVFLSGAAVQARRGHVGIEAVAVLLCGRARTISGSSSSMSSASLFCAFFAWKSWTLLHEAWVDEQTRPRPGGRRCGSPTR